MTRGNSLGPRGRVSALLALTLSGCGGGGSDIGEHTPQPAQPATPPPEPVSAKLYRQATASGINHGVAFPSDFTVPVTTGGVAAGDYDGDGDIDVFIVRGELAPNLLYRNEGNLRFVEVAFEAGLAFTRSATENYRHSGPTFADMDGDGHLDLFIGGLDGDPSLIFRNNGDGTFTDVTEGSGIDEMLAERTISAAFGDYDLDGDLDLALSHWGTRRDPKNIGDTEHLWRNDSEVGRIKFTSVSVEAGIASTILIPDPDAPLGVVDGEDYTFTPTFARIDGDLYPDLLMVADFNNTQLFMNNGDGTFTNATDTGVLTDDNGMGSALGDFDNDGDLDWFVTSIHSASSIPIAGRNRPPNGNRLYSNDNGTFTDVTARARVADGGWGWGACFLDLDNDGHLDIYHTNGYDNNPWGNYTIDPSKAFLSDGDGRFTEAANDLGLLDTGSGRGVVCADFDNDGDVDILVVYDDPVQAAVLWENTGNSNNFLKVKLEGLPPNTEAAGARIKARIGEVEQMREVMIGSNFTSQNPAEQIFGLGSAASVDELTVEWPGDPPVTTTLMSVGANQNLVLPHPDL